MSDYTHHIMMVNYYQRLSKIIERKIFKVRYLKVSAGKMSEIERKLRLKKLEVDDNIDFHTQMYVKNFVPDGTDYVEQPSEKAIFEYVSLFKVKKKASVTSDDF
ncbi:MAG: hypothetical protein SLAVMIC_00943 [uncultured marine phage]|uniref:Uncharacterized protein n=1 Tax=uncultured marine phage TaxID=707152 RepID=A0A8D9FQN4_9VIRU|nr:MAG: hypothetical protein SLAVMIC_00943 [uncultured marine phage]